MTEQQQLGLGDRFNLQSPVFQARPGWGGQLANLIRLIIASKVFMLFVTLIVAVLATYSIVQTNVRRVFPDSTLLPQESAPNIANESAVFQETALAGQGVTHLARHALQGYLTQQNFTLSDEQKVYAEDYLKRQVGSMALQPGQNVYFDIKDIMNAVTQAQNLKDWQIANLKQYSQQVNW